MAEQPSQPVPPPESTLALSFLREDIQDVRQDVRQTTERIDALRTEMSERFDQTNGRIDELGKQLDSRYARMMAMLITCTGILVSALGAAVAVLK